MKKHSFFSTLLYVVFVVFILLAILVAVMFVSKYTNGFTGSFTGFYLQTADGENISGESERDFVKGERYRFTVVYTLGFLTEEASGYTVKIIPNVTKETNFDYTVNGENHSYSEIEDLTVYFDISKYDDYFYFAANMDLPAMLSLIHGNKTVSGVPVTLDNNSSYYTLIVSSADGKSKVEMQMKLRSEIK